MRVLRADTDVLGLTRNGRVVVRDRKVIQHPERDDEVSLGVVVGLAGARDRDVQGLGLGVGDGEARGAVIRVEGIGRRVHARAAVNKLTIARHLGPADIARPVRIQIDRSRVGCLGVAVGVLGRYAQSFRGTGCGAAAMGNDKVIQRQEDRPRPIGIQGRLRQGRRVRQHNAVLRKGRVQRVTVGHARRRQVHRHEEVLDTAGRQGDVEP